VNAAEQAIGLELTSKIAGVVNLFKAQFPDAKADLKPWANDAETRELVDPDSIDIGFHLPGWSRRFQSRSILVQIRFFSDGVDGRSVLRQRGLLTWANSGAYQRLRTGSLLAKCSPVMRSKISSSWSVAKF
jgi:hypothetical protein